MMEVRAHCLLLWDWRLRVIWLFFLEVQPDRWSGVVKLTQEVIHSGSYTSKTASGWRLKTSVRPKLEMTQVLTLEMVLIHCNMNIMVQRCQLLASSILLLILISKLEDGWDDCLLPWYKSKFLWGLELTKKLQFITIMAQGQFTVTMESLLQIYLMPSYHLLSTSLQLESWEAT